MKTDKAANKTTHTPGPWTVGEYTGHGNCSILDKDGHQLAGAYMRASVYSGYGEKKDANSRTEKGQPEAWANARLIAAAPELLAALKELLDDAEELFAKDPRSQIVGSILASGFAARAAIYKAEGK